MKYSEREYALFSACGLNCGLCPRYHTIGSSRCPGCAGKGFSEKHPPCGILSCCARKDIEYCFLCAEYPCKKYEGAGQYDSFIIHRNQLRDMEKARNTGIELYKAELDEKVRILQGLLKNYDDGRRKSFFCATVNLLELGDVGYIAKRLENETEPEATAKEKAATAVRFFEEAAKDRGIILTLRKKQSSAI